MTFEIDLMYLNKLLKEDADRVLSTIKPDDCPNDAINWGDLKVIDVMICRSLAEGVFYEILIDEASPDSTELHNAVLAGLQKYAFPVRIKTEW
jgi:hypothetical protein